MRHGKLRTRLNRPKGHRKATVKNMLRGLFTHERIITTLTKAKVCSGWADKMITLAKKNDLAAIRKAESILQDKTLVKKLFKEIGPRFENRQGGYTRVIRYLRRRGDGSVTAILELTEKEVMIAQETKPENKKVDVDNQAEPKKVVEKEKTETKKPEPEKVEPVDDVKNSDSEEEKK